MESAMKQHSILGIPLAVLIRSLLYYENARNKCEDAGQRNMYTEPITTHTGTHKPTCLQFSGVVVFLLPQRMPLGDKETTA